MVAEKVNYRKEALQAMWLMTHCQQAFERLQRAIKPEYFGNVAERFLIRAALEHHEKYGRVITEDALDDVLVKEERSGGLGQYNLEPDDVWDVYDELPPVAEEDLRRVLENVERFCWQMSLKGQSDRMRAALDKGDLDEAATALAAAQSAAAATLIKGSVFPRDIYRDLSVETEEPILAGLPKLDMLMDGGLLPGEVGLYVASTGGGKSMFMCQVAAQAWLNGTTVVFYSLELGPEEVRARIMAHALGITINDLKLSAKSGPDPEHAALREEVAKARMRLTKVLARTGNRADLLIRDLVDQKASIATILADLSSLRREGHEPRLMVIDYADKLSARQQYKNRWETEDEIASELAQFARAQNVAIWTASQTNRPGASLSASDRNPTAALGKVAGAYSKTFGAAFVICGVQDAAMKKRAERSLVLAKARRGPYSGKHFLVKEDFAHGRFLASAIETDYDDGSTAQANSFEPESDDPFDRAENEDNEMPLRRRRR